MKVIASLQKKSQNYPFTKEVKDIISHEVNSLQEKIRIASERFNVLNEFPDQPPEWWSTWQKQYQDTGMRLNQEWKKPLWKTEGEYIVKIQMRDALQDINKHAQYLRDILQSIIPTEL